MTTRTKNTFKALGLGLLAIPTMFAFVGCGSDIDQKAVCNTNKTYTASSAEEFIEKTTGNSFITVNTRGYRVTVETNAEGFAGPEGYQTKYTLKTLSNAAVRMGLKKEENQLALKTTMNYDIVGVKGNVTMESYVLDGNLYVHTLPTTIEKNYTSTTIADQKLLIEGMTADSAMQQIGKMETAYDEDTIMNFIKLYQDSATFQISEKGNDIGFKVIFDESVSFGSMTNVVAYVNVDGKFGKSTEVSNGYMIKQLRIEGDYTTTAGSGVAAGSISMNGKMSVTISEYWGDGELNVIHPSLEGYRAASIGDVAGLLK